jgi:hypothetical protein
MFWWGFLVGFVAAAVISFLVIMNNLNKAKRLQEELNKLKEKVT